MLPERYVFLAMRAYRKELISRARLAECLCTTENDTAVRLLRYVASVAELTQEDEAEPSRTRKLPRLPALLNCGVPVVRLRGWR